MKIEAQIVGALRVRLPDAMAIYLFGSIASGEAGPRNAGRRLVSRQG
ncbi:hypothetical protein WOC76_17760 [Methylocystis sp. IM3]